MHMYKIWLVLVALLMGGGVVYADMVPCDLRLELRMGPKLCCSPDSMALELLIHNTSGRRVSIAVPGHPKRGLHLYDLVLMSRTEETMKWTIAREHDGWAIPVVDSEHKYEISWHLNPGETYTQLLIVKRVPMGAFKLQAKYRPVLSRLYPYLFVHVDEEGVVDPKVDLTEQPQLVKEQGDFYSNSCELHVERMVVPERMSGVQRAIYNDNTNDLLRLLRSGKELPKGWPVLNAQLYSQVVLSSLPTYSHTYLVVDTKKGVRHYSLSYRLGKVFVGRSRLATMMHMIGVHRVPFRISDEQDTRLMWVKRV